MLIDTHVHLVDLGRLRYPWLDSVPELNRDATHEDYTRQARQVGIDGALHMEVDVHEDDMEAESEMVAELMGRPGSLLLGAIAACRPESDAFPAYLERQLDAPHVKGLRRVLHTMPDELSRTAVFRRNVARLSGTRLPYDVCVSERQLPLAIELVDACPDVQFVLDHCGVPNVLGGEREPWSTHVAELARRPHVAAKVSGVIAYGNGNAWTLEDIAPYVEHVIESFGYERLVWGSDSPVCTLGGPIASWVAATRALVDGASGDEKAALFRDNARRLWSLGG